MTVDVKHVGRGKHAAQESNPVRRSSANFYLLLVAYGFQVCKTCSESNQTCLGYTQPVYQRPSSHRRHSSHEDREDPNTWSRSPSRSPPRMHKVEQLQQPKPGYQASFEVVSSAKSDGPGAGATLPRKENDQMSEESPASNHTSLSTGTARNRVPYFRYFGPTAIVPGFKQMVVQVRDNHQRSNHSLSAGGLNLCNHI